MFIEMYLLTTLGTMIAAGMAIAVVTYVVTRFHEHIVSWFQERSEEINADETKIAFTLKEKMASGECAFVQGIFDKKTDKIVDAQRIKSQQVDDEIREIHSTKTLAIYQ